MKSNYKSVVDNKKELLDLVKQDPWNLQYGSKELKNDPEIVLEAVKRCGKTLRFASDSLKNNKQIIFEAAKEEPSSLKYISKDLGVHSQFIQMVSKKGDFDTFLDNNNNDRKIVFSSVQKDGLKLKYASDELKNDKIIVMTAVKQNGLALKFCPFSDDFDIVMEAVKQNGTALRYCSKRLRDDEKIVHEAIKKRGKEENIFIAPKNPLFYASERLKDDEEIVLLSLKTDGNALEFVSNRLKNNKELVMKAIEKNALAIQFVHQDLKLDEEINRLALKKNPKVIKFLPESFKEERNILLDLIQRDPSKFSEYVHFKIFKDDPIFFIQAYRNHPNVLNEKNLPCDILFSVALKLLEQGYEETEIKPILKYVIENCKKSEFHLIGECSYHLGKFYFYGNKKDFKKAKSYFEESIKKGCQKSIIELNKLNKYLELDSEKLKIVESCSSEKNYIFEKIIYSSPKRSVYKVKNKTDQQVYALKKIQIDIMDFNETLNEVTSLIKLKSEFICEISDFFIQENEEYEYFYFCIVMPLYNVDLFTHLQKNEMDEQVILLNSFKGNYSNHD
jgi:hypothetical protein